MWEGWAEVHSKDRGGGAEPSIARVQLLGQPAVIDDLSMTSPNKWLLNLVHDSVLKTITPISCASTSLTEEYTL